MATNHMMNLRGKQYLTVAGRIALFRQDFPLTGDTPGAIVTERQPGTDGRVSFVARVMVNGVVVATGHAEEPANMNAKNIGGRVVEKVETSAIGRALGAAGYGTDKAFEDDEDDEGQSFIADSPQTPPPISNAMDWAKFDAFLSGLGVTRDDVVRAANGESLRAIAGRPGGKYRLEKLARDVAEDKAAKQEADAAHDHVPPPALPMTEGDNLSAYS
jgi:hypothetical protein